MVTVAAGAGFFPRPTRQDAQDYGTLARVALRSGELKNARDHFKKALDTLAPYKSQMHLEYLSTLSALVNVLQQLGNTNDAVKLLEDAIWLVNKDSFSDVFAKREAHKIVGIYRYISGDTTGARQEFHSILNKEHIENISDKAELAAIFNNSALIALDDGLFEDAENEFGRALELKNMGAAPHHASISTLNNSGILFQNTGRFELAQRHFGEAYEISRDFFGDSHSNTNTIVSNIKGLFTLRKEIDREFSAPSVINSSNSRSFANFSQIMQLKDNSIRIVDIYSRPISFESELFEGFSYRNVAGSREMRLLRAEVEGRLIEDIDYDRWEAALKDEGVPPQARPHLIDEIARAIARAKGDIAHETVKAKSALTSYHTLGSTLLHRRIAAELSRADHEEFLRHAIDHPWDPTKIAPSAHIRNQFERWFALGLTLDHIAEAQSGVVEEYKKEIVRNPRKRIRGLTRPYRLPAGSQRPPSQKLVAEMSDEEQQAKRSKGKLAQARYRARQSGKAAPA